MPTAKQAMYACLSGDSGVQAVVGAKVYPDQAPENAVNPYLVFGVVSDVKPKTMRGTINARKVRIQLTGFCDTRAQAEALEAALEALLHGKGPNVTLGGLVVKSSLIDDDAGAADEDEAPRPGEESGTRVVRLDVLWWV